MSKNICQLDQRTQVYWRLHIERNTKHAGLYTTTEVKSLMTQSGIKPSTFLFSMIHLGLFALTHCQFVTYFATLLCILKKIKRSQLSCKGQHHDHLSGFFLPEKENRRLKQTQSSPLTIIKVAWFVFICYCLPYLQIFGPLRAPRSVEVCLLLRGAELWTILHQYLRLEFSLLRHCKMCLTDWKHSLGDRLMH